MATRTRENESTEVKMFINQREIDEVMKKDDQAIAYIIQQNSRFVQLNLDLNKKCDELDREKDELETYNDRLEKTKTCLQGYVHNLFDLLTKYTELYDLQKKVIKQYHVQFLFTQIVPLLLFIIGIVGSCIYTFPVYIILTIYICLLTSHCVIVYNKYTYLRNTHNANKIKVILEDIAKTKKSNSYIDDLVDNA